MGRGAILAAAVETSHTETVAILGALECVRALRLNSSTTASVVEATKVRNIDDSNAGIQVRGNVLLCSESLGRHVGKVSSIRGNEVTETSVARSIAGAVKLHTVEGLNKSDVVMNMA